MTVYETKVVDMGAEAEMFQAENMMILFGEEVPEDLANYAYIIHVNPIDGEIKEGMTLTVADEAYTITAVGNVVNKNLGDLGHITLNFNGAEEAELPGTLYLEEKALPNVEVGTTLTIQ
jgi:PTS system glucitol/sorbitol-specific IIA component